MGLPKLDTPKYSCVLPTSEKTVTYRPFLVGEQKVLLIAQESEDANTQIREMIRLIDLCCDDVSVKLLPTTDLEYLFLQLRIKSVGETSDVILECESCQEENAITLDLETAKIKQEVENIDNFIKLTDSISIELQWPSYSMIENIDMAEDLQSSDMFTLMADCIVSVIDEEEVHTRDDFSKKELVSFYDSMSLIMFDDVQQFFNSAPTLVIEAVFNCDKCKKHNKIELAGVGNFFV